MLEGKKHLLISRDSIRPIPMSKKFLSGSSILMSSKDGL